jgi:hypothetical protein
LIKQRPQTSANKILLIEDRDNYTDLVRVTQDAISLA